ncbi:hypothetical protein NFI96_004767 [Prochilodus magdalenae]|nr:hypothetical protein NFI96_004767 [Prochilodus magdalenae]
MGFRGEQLHPSLTSPSAVQSVERSGVKLRPWTLEQWRRVLWSDQSRFSSLGLAVPGERELASQVPRLCREEHREHMVESSVREWNRNQESSCTQREVWECRCVGKEDKVPADGAVGVEVEQHQVFWTCDNEPFISVLTTVPPHPDWLGVSTEAKAGLVLFPFQPMSIGIGSSHPQEDHRMT